MKRRSFDNYIVKVTPLSKVDGGGFIASVEEIPGCVSDGQTREEAIENLRGAFDDVIAALGDWGQSVPAGKAKAPAQFLFRPSRTMYERMKLQAEEDGVSLNAFVAEAVAMRIGSVAAEKKSAVRKKPTRRASEGH